MKVKKLIKALQKFDGEEDVVVCINLDEGFITKEIHIVENCGGPKDTKVDNVGLFINMYFIKNDDELVKNLSKTDKQYNKEYQKECDDARKI